MLLAEIGKIASEPYPKDAATVSPVEIIAFCLIAVGVFAVVLAVVDAIIRRMEPR